MKDVLKLRPARKVGRSVLLPNREALAKLTGITERRAIGDYAKLTPSGRNALEAPDIFDLGAGRTKSRP